MVCHNRKRKVTGVEATKKATKDKVGLKKYYITLWNLDGSFEEDDEASSKQNWRASSMILLPCYSAWMLDSIVHLLT